MKTQAITQARAHVKDMPVQEFMEQIFLPYLQKAEDLAGNFVTKFVTIALTKALETILPGGKALIIAEEIDAILEAAFEENFTSLLKEVILPKFRSLVQGTDNTLDDSLYNFVIKGLEHLFDVKLKDLLI